MLDALEIRPTGPVRGRIRPPGSKSLANRALVCAALAEGESFLDGVADCEDIRAMIESLGRLGVAVEHDPAAATARVVGCGGRMAVDRVALDVANSGTTMRFLTALASLAHGVVRLDGSPRMRQRPIADLLDALRQLGGDAISERGNGCPPVVVRGRGLRGGRAVVAADVSSQFLSGLLMAAPYAQDDVELVVEGRQVSWPYIAITRAVMASFGVEIHAEEDRRFHVAAPRRYRGCCYTIEPDASAAGYFLAAAAITQGEVTVEGLSRDSLQGDVALCDCLERMGCRVSYSASEIAVAGRPLHGIEVDMNALSDAAPTLAVTALFAAGATTIRGVGHMRHKETDRVHALAVELRKLGANVEERPDGLKITPGPLHGAAIDTHDDHRMAMSFALAGLAIPGVAIRNPACTAKTYPRFFDDLASLTAH